MGLNLKIYKFIQNEAMELKNRISRELFFWKRRIARILGKGIALMIRLLPISVLWKGEILNQIFLIGVLDYKRKNRILLKVNSFTNAVRLKIKEQETVRWLEEYLKVGEVFYDIGANNGTFSLIAKEINGGKNEVYAFEPGFSNFNVLCENIFLNHSQKLIKSFNVALSDKTGLLPFVYSSISSGAAMHVLEKSLPSDKSLYQYVISYRIDDF